VEIEDSVALVTGGGSGIGRAVATALAERGALVAILDVDEQNGAEVARQLDAELIVADVSDLHECLRAVERVTERFGGLDLVHLNAGVSTSCGVAEDFDLDAYRRAMGVNLDGVVFGVHAALPALRQRGGGAIVATASLAGLMDLASDPIYTLTKHAVIGLVRAMAPNLAPLGITVNAVCPGMTDTNILGAETRAAFRAADFPLIPPEQIAEAVLGAVLGGATGRAWVCQPGREAVDFEFRRVPGPRSSTAEGRVPPLGHA
jgi:NAD(P)-dependent dehydrogenase (short-subunit alcohol dehydrogenase family)